MSNSAIKTVIRIVALSGSKGKSGDDDIHSLSDKVSSKYTVTLLILFNLFVTKSQVIY